MPLLCLDLPAPRNNLLRGLPFALLKKVPLVYSLNKLLSQKKEKRHSCTYCKGRSSCSSLDSYIKYYTTMINDQKTFNYYCQK